MHLRGDNFDQNVPAWVKNLGGWVRDVVDFCYPGICPACREVCPPGNELCETCDSQLATLAEAPACLLCGMTLGYYNAPCSSCHGRGVPHYERVIRLGKFAAPIQSLIHQLKFHRAYMVGELLADRMLAQDAVESLLLEADCLVPVPLHGMRQFARGYNQSEIIAMRLSKARDIPVVHALSRVRNTDAQTHLNTRAKRMANLKDAFRLCDGDRIEGQRVVVVDDVTTTGATLRMLARALKPARPTSLSALVVAVAEQKTSRI